LIVIVELPAGVEEDVEIVRVEVAPEVVGVTDVGVKRAVTPDGKTDDIERETELLNPLSDVRVTVYVVELPGVTD
jgi:hypothetical protein